MCFQVCVPLTTVRCLKRTHIGNKSISGSHSFPPNHPTNYVASIKNEILKQTLIAIHFFPRLELRLISAPSLSLSDPRLLAVAGGLFQCAACVSCCPSRLHGDFLCGKAILLFPDQKIISCTKEYDRMPSELVGKLSSCRVISTICYYL